jgi:hypothetical protein
MNRSFWRGQGRYFENCGVLRFPEVVFIRPGVTEVGLRVILQFEHLDLAIPHDLFFE